MGLWGSEVQILSLRPITFASKMIAAGMFLADTPRHLHLSEIILTVFAFGCIIWFATGGDVNHLTARLVTLAFTITALG